MRAKRFLKIDEKTVLKTECKKFPKLFRVNMKRGITPKIHEVSCYVPKFLEKWGTIGMFREDDTEEQHHLMHGILDNMVSIRSGGQRMSLALKRRMIFRKANKIVPKKRNMNLKKK